MLSSIVMFFSALHANLFEIWKKILWNWRFDLFIAQSIKWCDVSGVHSESICPFRQYFFLKKAVFPLVSLLIAELISLDTSDKPSVEFFLEIASPSWIILSLSFDDLNSIDWLLKSRWWILLKQFLFCCCKRILIWQNISNH